MNISSHPEKTYAAGRLAVQLMFHQLFEDLAAVDLVLANSVAAWASNSHFTLWFIWFIGDISNYLMG